MNELNKKIWDDIFNQEPPQPSDEDCCCCDNGEGGYKPATPIGYEPEMKEYSALKEIIEGAVKNKTYKTWKIGSKLEETYSEDHKPIEKYDVIYLFTSDWEEPIIPVLVKEITDTEVELWWLLDEETKKKKEKYDR